MLHLHRARDEAGNIGVFVLSIMMLLVGTSIMVFGAVGEQMQMARESKEYNKARQQLDDSAAGIVRDLNNPLFDPRVSGFGGSGAGGQFWGYDATERLATAMGSSGDSIDYGGKIQQQRYPVRWLNVASKYTGDGSIVYAVPANAVSPTTPDSTDTVHAGMWTFGLSSGAAGASASTVRGQFLTQRNTADSVGSTAMFDYALLGGNTTINATGTTATPMVTKFATATSVSGSTASEYRSMVNAQFDRENLRARVTGQGWRECRTDRPVSSPNHFPGYQYCSEGAVNIPNVVSAAPGQIVTIVVKGDARIPNDINVAGAGQVHIYVTGAVFFAKPTAQGRQILNNTFIFTPDGTCATETSSHTVDVRGALACQRLSLPATNNRFLQVKPLPDTYQHVGYGKANRIVFIESSGHVDGRTPGVVR